MTKPKTIIPNISLLPALKPAAHCYLIQGEKNTLIDTSIRENKDHLAHQLSYFDLGFEDIDDVIYTHCHYDHTGGGEFFPNSTVYSHPLCHAKLLYQEEHTVHALKFQVQLPTRIPDQMLEDGDCYLNGEFRFLVLHTPGHTDDSICLLEQNLKILISGDTVFSLGIPSLITDSGSAGSLMYSVLKLQKYEIDTVLPSHGRVEYNASDSLAKSKENIIKRIKHNNQKVIKEVQQCGPSKF